MINVFFNLAFVLFFFSTGALLWLFLITNSWVRLTPEDQAALNSIVSQPTPSDPNGTVWNPEVILTRGNVYAVRCTNPYQYHVGVQDNLYGIAITTFASVIICACIIVPVVIKRHVEFQFSAEQLRTTFGSERDLRRTLPIDENAVVAGPV